MARKHRADPTVAEILGRKKASVQNAPLPAGSPAWDEIRNERLSDVERKARLNVPGYKTIRKLLSTGVSTNDSGPSVANLLDLLRRLDAARIAYRLEQIRQDGLCLQVAVPGERWEIELLESGEVEIEIFRSSGEIRDAEALDDLFARFSG